MPTNYSENQKSIVRWQIKNNVRDRKPVFCQKCSGQHIDELLCVVCDKWKGLEDYDRAQRKNTDSAVCQAPLYRQHKLTLHQRCQACTYKLVTHKPVNQEVYENENNAFRTPDSSNGVQPDYWTHSNSDVNSEVSALMSHALSDPANTSRHRMSGPLTTTTTAATLAEAYA